MSLQFSRLVHYFGLKNKVVIKTGCSGGNV